ncbi:Hsp70 family protein [Plantactinospora sp. CA-294935]|uniref:Hsp70 family protein n=1 Tax=Plantactinospora sp. CA-294935 TaxID=3240012 RepID=UPI003D8C6FBD
MVTAPRLAIDFGTSHTVAVCQWQAGAGRPLLFDASPLLPSAVFVDSDGRLRVGRDALRAGRTEPGSLEPHPKRRIDEGVILLGRTEVAVVDLVAAVLGRCADEAVRVVGGAVRELVLTHPAAWGPRRRQVLVDAAARAGLPPPAMVAEPTAAATHFTTVLARPVRTGDTVVVYDFGAGTFDVAVLRRRPDGWDVAASQGLSDLGGLDLDDVVVERVRAAVVPAGPDDVRWRRLSQPGPGPDLRHHRSLWEEARAAKEELSRRSTAGLRLPIFERDVHVTREEFEAAAAAPIERSVALTAATVSSSGIDAGRIAGLFLVGGASRVPLVATCLHRRLGIVPTVVEQPELVVAQGALLTAEADTPAGTSPTATPGAVAGISAPPAASAAGAGSRTVGGVAGSANIASPLPGHPPPPTGSGPDRSADAAKLISQNGPARDDRRRRRSVWIGAGAATLVLLVVAVLVVVWATGPDSGLSRTGRANEQVIKSSPLREFARPWLDDVSGCEQRPPDTYGGTATEYVACTGDGWEVQFRALADQTERDRARTQRVRDQGGTREPYAASRTRSGALIRYVFRADQFVIYWDDDTSAMIGDLTVTHGSTLDADDLLAVWRQYVR